jgi:hypothetical protein
LIAILVFLALGSIAGYFVVLGVHDKIENDREIAQIQRDTERVRQEAAELSVRGNFNFDAPSKRSPSPTAASASGTPKLLVATLIKPVRHGNETLPIGTEIRIISSSGSVLRLDYRGQQIEIPADAASVR